MSTWWTSTYSKLAGKYKILGMSVLSQNKRAHIEWVYIYIYIYMNEKPVCACVTQ